MRKSIFLIIIFLAIAFTAESLPIRGLGIPYNKKTVMEFRMMSELADAKEAVAHADYNLALMHTETIRAIAANNDLPLPNKFQEFERATEYARLDQMVREAEEIFRLTSNNKRVDAQNALQKALDFAEGFKLILPPETYILYHKIQSQWNPAVYNRILPLQDLNNRIIA